MLNNFTLAYRKPECSVRLVRVHALGLLQVVRTNLVGEADAAAFVTRVIDEHSAADVGDDLQRLCELLAAVAALRAEDVAGEALGVNARKHWIGGGDVAEMKHH